MGNTGCHFAKSGKLSGLDQFFLGFLEYGLGISSFLDFPLKLFIGLVQVMGSFFYPFFQKGLCLLLFGKIVQGYDILLFLPLFKG